MDITEQELGPFVHAHVHYGGVWHTHVLPCVENTLLLGPEWPINVVSFLLSCGSFNTQMKQCNTTHTMRTIHTRERLMILSLAQTNKNVWTFFQKKISKNCSK